MNNSNEYLIVEVVVCSHHSNITCNVRYFSHLIIRNVQNFASGTIEGFYEYKSRFHCKVGVRWQQMTSVATREFTGGLLVAWKTCTI